MKIKKLVFGVGVNDAGYTVQPTVNGERSLCQFYRAWSQMIGRCYDANLQDRMPTYIGCTVCAEWLTFSNFKKWMETQSWQAKQLDKDLLVKGNKCYSPETCVFIDKVINTFMTNCDASRGEWPIGASFHKPSGKFRAACRNPFTKKLEHLGYFTCQEQAHLAWKKRKHELACQLADLQTDERVAAALRLRYA